MGWSSIEEYVAYFVPNIGVAETARALRMTPSELSKRYPKECDVSVSDAIRDKRPRKRLAFKDPVLVCERCGVEMVKRNANHHYCPECAVAVKKIRNAEARRRRADSSLADGEME